jgi:hypothetical protein
MRDSERVSLDPAYYFRRLAVSVVVLTGCAVVVLCMENYPVPMQHRQEGIPNCRTAKWAHQAMSLLWLALVLSTDLAEAVIRALHPKALLSGPTPL